ncbi:hypothetical protein [Rhodoferax sp.]|uniref:hypothetical protein n=1 Tax=Rhodoferax sp. TaxID=50421 RepID=UPI0028423EBA|nr:hypothetical protein [Rhodoferax sp.]MDR3370716.1 hypothetical protein [Rhodoferax sp.]
MAKTDLKTDDVAAADQATTAATPAMGSLVQVKVAAGCMLVNNETGAYFEPDVATPVTVTTTLLRRLQDGDVTLVG